jgi:hypothetical protein
MCLSYELGIMGEGITSIRVLDEKEFQEYTKAANSLTEFLSYQQLYKLTLLNYEDFLGIIIKISKDYDDDPTKVNYSILEGMILNINRYLINYLFSFRTFLDHTGAKLKTKYGKNSIKVINFEKACTLEYDSYFSYRFLYKLRNYSQHCGLPLEGFTIETREEPEFSGIIVNNLIVKFKKETLLKFDGWSSDIEQEINDLPEEFDVLPHVVNLAKSLDRINRVLINDNISEANNNAEFIEQLILPAKNKEGIPIIFRFTNDGMTKVTDMMHIPLDLIEYVKLMKSQYFLEKQAMAKTKS